jgi:hypothetical protein
MGRAALFVPVLLVVGTAGAPIRAQAPLQPVANDDWCRDRDGDSEHEHFCEVRQATLPASTKIHVDASPNGGIEVQGWDRTQVELKVKIVAAGDTEAEARELASQVQVATTGTVQATGPQESRHHHWWASYRLSVPRGSDLWLQSLNGGISAHDVAGTLEFETTNGGVSLRDVSGRVHGRTTNGGLDIRLAGTGWKGEGLDVVTTNGGVNLALPADYNARVETGTTNGGLTVDFPITVQGRLDQKHLAFDVGRSGPLLRAVTTNGGVRVRKE